MSSRYSLGGMGLGWAIAHHLVKLHHRTIEVASAGEGRGATFTVKQPFPVHLHLNAGLPD